MVWKRAWWIAKHNLKRSKMGFVCSIVFNLYFCFFISMGMSDLLQQSPAEIGYGDTVVADVLMLTCISVMGFMMTKEYRNYWRSDTFSKRVMFLRSMPIRVEELVLGRFLTLLASLFVFSFVFFIPLYFISGIADRLHVVQYVEWAVSWVGFGIIMGGLYVYAELGGSGKKYLLISVLGGVATLLLAAGAAFAGFGIVSGTIELVERFGLLVPVGSLLLAAIITRVWMKLTERRIRTRDYT